MSRPKSEGSQKDVVRLADRLAPGLRRVTSSSHRYIPEVDGLRFIAIFCVIFFHIWYAATHAKGITLASSAWDWLLYPIQHGYRGVHLFFVISGFILGLPFAAQYLAGGRSVAIGRYYLRRVTRLEPPYIVALLGIYFAAMVLRTDDTTDPGFFSGLVLRLFYLHSAVRGVPSMLNGVTWTLEVEVQFYLLAPFFAKAFALAPRHRRTLFVALICAMPLVAPFVPRSDLSLVGYAQFFFTGFLLADLYVTRAGTARITPALGDVLGVAGLLAFAFMPYTPVLHYFLPWLLALLFLGALFGRRFRAVLQRSEIAVLGGMCYSLYLLHYPPMSFLAQRVLHNGMEVLQACLILGAAALPAVLTAGILFYVLLERPCMKPDWPKALWAFVTRARRAPSAAASASNPPVS